MYEHVFKSDPATELVIVGFCLANDIVEESTPSALRPQRAPKTSIGYLLSKYLDHLQPGESRLRYDRRLEHVMARFGLTNPPVFSTDLLSSEDNKRRWPYTADFLTSFGHEVKADGKKFLLVLIPSKELVLDDYFSALLKITDTPLDRVDRFGFRDYLLGRLQSTGIAVLDLTPTFRDGAGQRPADLYFVGDAHWNPAGHQLAADTIYDHLSKTGVQ